MKPSYAPIALQTGHHQAGIVRLQVAPREWIDSDATIDFLTNSIVDPVTLITGKSFIDLEFIYPSYLYEEKIKSGKNGSYSETKISGTINYTSPAIASTLQTLKYHELVAIVTDTRRQRRFIGNKHNGLSFTAASKNSNVASASQSTEVDLLIELEDAPPFYGWDIITPYPGTGTSGGDSGSTGGGGNGNNPISIEELDFNTTGDTTITLTPDRLVNFGRWPVISLWVDNGNGTYSRGNMPIDATGTPPDTYIVRNSGGIGKIILSI